MRSATTANCDLLVAKEIEMSKQIESELSTYIKKLEAYALSLRDPRERAVFDHGLRSIRVQLENIDRDTSYLFYVADKAAAEAEIG
jgi:hypothetical protein